MQISREYANYKEMPNISYRIIEYLMTDKRAEMLWKLLKYPVANAYSMPDLSMEEKAALIYKGEAIQSDYNVFFDFMLDDAEDVMKSFLRIYPSEIYPTNRVHGLCDINIEVFVHSKINHLSNYKTRVDMMIQILLEVLNGSDVNGIGVMFFDNQASRYNQVKTIGQRPFKGKLLKMSVNIG